MARAESGIERETGRRSTFHEQLLDQEVIIPAGSNIEPNRGRNGRQ